MPCRRRVYASPPNTTSDAGRSTTDTGPSSQSGAPGMAVAHGALRLREAAKLGFSSAYGPLKEEKASPGIQFAGIRQLAQLVDRVMR